MKKKIIINFIVGTFALIAIGVLSHMENNMDAFYFGVIAYSIGLFFQIIIILHYLLEKKKRK